MSIEFKKIEVDGCPLCSASRKQTARAHSSGEAEYYAVASAASEAMLIGEVLLFTGQEVRTELLLDSAAARGMCRNHTSFVNESSLATAVGETRSGHGWSVYIRREPRRLVDKVIACPKTDWERRTTEHEVNKWWSVHAEWMLHKGLVDFASARDDKGGSSAQWRDQDGRKLWCQLDR